MSVVLESNRFSAALTDIEARCAKLDSESLAKFNTSLDITFDEQFQWQEWKSQAQLRELITLPEAQFLYSHIGQSPETFNTQPVAIKAFITKVIGELAVVLTRGRL
jgi:hypothetical protein